MLLRFAVAARAGLRATPSLLVPTRALASSSSSTLPPPLTAAHLLATDSKLTAVTPVVPKYSRPAADAAVLRAQAALEAKGHVVVVAATAADALRELKARIPAGATVHSTSSISLQEIGYIDYVVEGKLPFTNLNGSILAEKDPKKQGELRRQAALADVVLTTPFAVTEAGEILTADASGTRVTPTVAGRTVVFVVGANKIVPTHADAMRRLHEYVYPLESARVRAFYNMPNGASTIANIVTVNTANPYAAKRVHVILVKASLGY